jgi:rSAM/selenodomain-associated transferase 1
VEPVIVLFARAPRPGRVKTRLIPALGAEGACAVHEWLVRDALARLAELGPLELHTDDATTAWPEFRGIRRVQVPGDLGARMLAAMEGRHAMIVGSDAPAIPAAHLRLLLTARSDVALGPADDGGYYAIACRRTHPEMFAGVEWSSGRECRQTADACHEAGLSVELGASWFDIDDEEDLRRAIRQGLVCLPVSLPVE